MNLIPAPSAAGYSPLRKSPGVSRTDVNKADAINPRQAVSRLPATKEAYAVVDQPRQPMRESRQLKPDSNEHILRSVIVPESEYLPARYDNNIERAKEYRQRPEIQAFLNASDPDSSFRRGRFVDIQA